VKEGWNAPSPTLPWADFILMIECTPESGHRHFVYSVVETEANWDHKKTNERGSSLVVSLGLSCRYNGKLRETREGCSCLMLKLL
jgi:hypothetical protein